MKKLGLSVTALLMGGLIYVFWRKDTLMMFIWFDRIGLTDIVCLLRDRAGRLSMCLPNWILFSLPNALWLFGGLLVFDFIWGNKSSVSKLFWFSAFWFIAVSAEVGQALRIIPGRFDWQDITIMILAGSCAHIVTACARRQERRQEV